MSIEKSKLRKGMEFPSNPKIAKQEVITDQSDPRMIKFREGQGEFNQGYPRKTVKLEITEYESGPDEMKLKTTLGFYEGEPPLGYTAFWRKLLSKAMLEEKKKEEIQKWSQDLHIKIRDYNQKDRKSVLQLWKGCNLTQPWEEPAKDINRRLASNLGLILVGDIDNNIVATGIGRCDENRGWIEYVGVDSSFRRKGIARQLLKTIEDRARKMGCPEINLLMNPDNAAAIAFFQRTGYSTKKLAIMGKPLKQS